jgi:HEAT repeat protein
MKSLRPLFFPTLLIGLVALPLIVRGFYQPRVEGERLGGWLDRLNDPDPVTRAKAAEAIGQLGGRSPRAIPALADRALHEVDATARQKAIEALGVCSPLARADRKVLANKHQAAGTLLAALDDNDVEVRRRAPPALAALLQARRDFMPAEEDSERDLRERATARLARAVNDPDARVRVAVTAVLANLSDIPAEAEPGLLRTLRTPDRNVRLNALTALSNQTHITEQAIPHLIEVLHDPDITIGEWASTCLKRVGPKVAPALIEAFSKADDQDRIKLRMCLASLGSKAIPPLREALKNDNPAIRRGAADTLRFINPDLRKGSK